MPHTVRVTFHGIGPTSREVESGEQGVWLETASFERALDALASAPRREITFDDGNISDLEIALPRLVERGMKATFFVCAGRIGESSFLDVRDMQRLRDAGMTIGSHGMDHVPWRGLDAERLRIELAESKSRPPKTRTPRSQVPAWLRGRRAATWPPLGEGSFVSRALSSKDFVSRR